MIKHTYVCTKIKNNLFTYVLSFYLLISATWKVPIFFNILKIKYLEKNTRTTETERAETKKPTYS